MDKSIWHPILRWGFSGATAAYLVYNLVETQKAYATQLKELNGQLIHLSQAVGVHNDESRTSSKVLVQICLNGAKTVDDRRRCVP